MQKNLYLNQKFTKFINNENFEFNRSKILKILNSDLLEDAYKTISKWQKYQPTPLESLNKLSKELGLKKKYDILLYGAIYKNNYKYCDCTNF